MLKRYGEMTWEEIRFDTYKTLRETPYWEEIQFATDEEDWEYFNMLDRMTGRAS